MEKKYLLLTVDSKKVNQPAINAALEDYVANEFIPGTWCIQTDVPADQFAQRLRTSVTGNNLVVVPLTADAIAQGYFPDDVQNFMGTAKVA